MDKSGEDHERVRKFKNLFNQLKMLENSIDKEIIGLTEAYLDLDKKLVQLKEVSVSKEDDSL